MTATYHALLVGVDAYKADRLRGCVNDVDAIQRILLGDRMRIPADRIRRLASPLPDARHASDLRAQPATLDHVRQALDELASRDVRPEDRVFIYFAGHGTRVQGASPRGQLFHREALVLADCDTAATDLRLLYDFELNERLRKIIERTRQVSLVLDCCYAASVVRDAPEPDWQPRCLDLSKRATEPSLHAAIAASAGEAGDAPHADLAMVEDCHVVAACLGHERAFEGSTGDGVRRGLFSDALISVIDDAADVDLHTVSWGRLWHRIHAAVGRRKAGQHPTMIGNAARAVFGGPPTQGDAGIPITQTGDGYEIGAGEMTRITRGARVAVYRETPRDFPLFGSRDDLDMRVGVLEVRDTTLGSASAVAEGPAFKLPHGARGRVIQAGHNARLRCAVVPRNAWLEAQLAVSPLLQVVSDPAVAEVKLEESDSLWFVTDDVHGVGSDGPPLISLRPVELGSARAVLEHYHSYSRPLAMAALATQLPGSLDLRLLQAPTRDLPAARALDHDLPEIESRGKRAYSVPIGARVCFQVHNRGPRQLRVTLVNAAASGKVQLLGDDVLAPRQTHTFWAHSSLGTPFAMTPPRGKTHCIDRPIAIGRTVVGHDLGHLKLDRTFADVLEQSRAIHRGHRGMDDRSGGGVAVPEEWTATQIVIETRRPPPPRP